MPYKGAMTDKLFREVHDVRITPPLTRRAALAAGAGLLAAPALAQPACTLGLPGHVKGPPVWRDLDQEELDAAYDQEVYQPHTEAVNSRLSALSFELRLRRGYPERLAYGEGADEALDLYRDPERGIEREHRTEIAADFI